MNLQYYGNIFIFHNQFHFSVYVFFGQIDRYHLDGETVYMTQKNKQFVVPFFCKKKE